MIQVRLEHPKCIRGGEVCAWGKAPRRVFRPHVYISREVGGSPWRQGRRVTAEAGPAGRPHRGWQAGRPVAHYTLCADSAGSVRRVEARSECSGNSSRYARSQFAAKASASSVRTNAQTDPPNPASNPDEPTAPSSRASLCSALVSATWLPKLASEFSCDTWAAWPNPSTSPFRSASIALGMAYSISTK